MNTHLKFSLFMVLAVFLMAVSFFAYLRPGFVLDLASRVWLCF